MKNQITKLAVCMLLLLNNAVQAQNRVVFNYTGSDQFYTVPAGVTEITVKAWGAGGAGGNYVFNDYGGGGGFAMGVIKVTPGETLKIIVGGGGKINKGPGAYGGGGAKYNGSNSKGGRGGGRSAIRNANDTELLTAGAGGGGGGCDLAIHQGAGGGGGLTGGYGNFGIYDGQPGTQTAGGAGGRNANTLCMCGSNDGQQFKGGDADAIDNGFNGSGGGGYCGGGSGTDYGDGGGGGGSSFIPKGGCTIAATDFNAANSADKDYKNAAGLGGQKGINGKNGRVVIYNFGFRIKGTPVPISAAGACDGAITFHPIDGIPPFTYLWSDGYTSQSRKGICPGKYIITVTDAMGCFKKLYRHWEDPALSLSATFTNASSKYCADGTVTATINNYSLDSNATFILYDSTNAIIETWYLNTDSSASHTFTNLTPGVYKVEATSGNQTVSQSGSIEGFCTFSFNDIIIDSIEGCAGPGGSYTMRLHYNGVACGDMNVVMKYLENGIEKIDTFYKEQNDFIIAGGYQVINPGVMLIATNGSCIDSTFFMANPIQCNKYHKVYVNYTSCGARVTDYWYTNSCDPGDMYFYMDGINNNIHIFTVGSGAAGGAGNIPDGIYQVYRADQMCTSGSKLITISGATWVAPNNLTASQVGTMQTVKLKWKSNNIVFSETFGFQIQVKMQNDTTWQEYNYPGGYPYNQKLFNFNIDNIVSDSVYEFRIRTDWYNAGLWSPVQTFCIGSNCSSARTAVEEDNMEANPLLLTPSPASNSINISIPDNDEALNQITVYDQIGNVVIKKLIQEGNNAITLDLSSITNGVYLVVVSTDTTTYSKKFVVIK